MKRLFRIVDLPSPSGAEIHSYPWLRIQGRAHRNYIYDERVFSLIMVALRGGNIVALSAAMFKGERVPWIHLDAVKSLNADDERMLANIVIENARRGEPLPQLYHLAEKNEALARAVTLAEPELQRLSRKHEPPCFR